MKRIPEGNRLKLVKSGDKTDYWLLFHFFLKEYEICSILADPFQHRKNKDGEGESDNSSFMF